MSESAESSASRTLPRSSAFWTLILYIGLALSIYSCYADQPAFLHGWSGVRLWTLVAAFCSMYHLLYLRRLRSWPMPFGSALLYTAGQPLLLWLLSRYNIGFVWVGSRLLGHIASMLPPRQWLLPMGAVVLATTFIRMFNDCINGVKTVGCAM